jgi:predicted Zn finger-like uncharacterized protein
MEVRCEKCQTEYELDDAKLKPGGVTVKCTQCGNMFRVRRRAQTGHGVAAPPTPPSPAPGAPTPPLGAPLPGSAPPTVGSTAAPRVWLVRDRDGMVQTCRELATLQQWVVQGRVTRECEISRTGRSWKQLGDIAELGSFFRIAEEVRLRHAEAASPELAAAPPVQASSPVPDPLAAPGAMRERSSTSGPPPASRPRPSRQAAVPQKVELPRPLELEFGPGPTPADAAASGPVGRPQLPAGSDSGAWAASRGRKLTEDDARPSGPTGGLGRGVPVGEAVVAGAHRPQVTVDDIMPARFEPIDADDDELSPPRGGVARWVLLISLLVLGGAGALLYALVLADRPTEHVVLVMPDAAAPAPVDRTPAADPGPVVAAARAAIERDTDAALAEAASALAALPPDTAGGETARAGVLVAQAQRAADAGDRERVAALASDAEQLAGLALGRQGDDRDARVALADALRLRGRGAAEVERQLRVVLAAEPGHRGALLSRALLRARDGSAADAVGLLQRLWAERNEPRVGYRLAVMLTATDRAAASAVLAQVVALAPEHAEAEALRGALTSAPVDTTDPMPPEVAPDDREAVPVGYESLLVRADKAAEAGDCRAAMALYDRALDDNPSSVEALTGLGYCHIEFKQFASAHAKFRAALGISPRYQEALIGIAEAYRFQGLREQAIAAYRAYLDEHPTGTRATMARKQLELLGGAEPAGDEPGPAESRPPRGGPAPTQPSEAADRGAADRADDRRASPKHDEIDLGERGE